MRYNVVLHIEREIEVSDKSELKEKCWEAELKEKCWEAVSKPLEDCIFDNENPGREDQFLTVTKLNDDFRDNGD